MRSRTPTPKEVLHQRQHFNRPCTTALFGDLQQHARDDLRLGFRVFQSHAVAEKIVNSFGLPHDLTFAILQNQLLLPYFTQFGT